MHVYTDCLLFVCTIRNTRSINKCIYLIYYAQFIHRIFLCEKLPIVCCYYHPGLLTVVVSYSAFVNETSQWYTIDLCSFASKLCLLLNHILKYLNTSSTRLLVSSGTNESYSSKSLYCWYEWDTCWMLRCSPWLNRIRTAPIAVSHASVQNIGFLLTSGLAPTACSECPTTSISI